MLPAVVSPADFILAIGGFLLVVFMLRAISKIESTGPKRERPERAESVDFRNELRCMGGPPPLGKERLGVDRPSERRAA